jgi:hypothetical protein
MTDSFFWVFTSVDFATSSESLRRLIAIFDFVPALVWAVIFQVGPVHLSWFLLDKPFYLACAYQDIRTISTGVLRRVYGTTDHRNHIAG